MRRSLECAREAASPAIKAGKVKPDLFKQLDTGGLEELHVDGVVEVPVRIEFVEADLGLEPVYGHPGGSLAVSAIRLGRDRI